MTSFSKLEHIKKLKEIISLEDIVQIQMRETNSNIIDKPTMPVAATLRYGDLVLEIHNGIDKYVLYILMKELQEHVG